MCAGLERFENGARLIGGLRRFENGARLIGGLGRVENGLTKVGGACARAWSESRITLLGQNYYLLATKAKIGVIKFAGWSSDND
jgi:hypothetical protein